MNASALAGFLQVEINKGSKEEDFRASEDIEEYRKMPYVATKGITYEACKVEKDDWKKNSACLILTRVLWGAAGNAKLDYKEFFTETF